MAGAIGLELVPDTVRVVLAAALAVVCKLVLVFGFWAVTPRLANGLHQNEEVPPPKEGMAAQEAHDAQGPPAPVVQPRHRKASAKTDPTFERAIDDLENGVV